MALIICPECEGKVSDQAEVCIHCGYPLTKKESARPQIVQNQVSFISKKPMYLFSVSADHLMIECGNCDKVYKFRREYFSQIDDNYCVPNKDIICPNCRNGIRVNSKIRSKQQLSTAPAKVKCPRCKSTQITTGARGVNSFWGLIGASKTVNRCANCGHTWQPR